MASIPASQIVSVTPGVLTAGGTALDLIALVLTQNARVPTGVVLSFPSYNLTASYFGAGSSEALFAQTYFLGSVNSTKKPGAILFSQGAIVAISGFLRGGSVANLSVTQLQSISGALNISIDGYAFSVTNLNLASATSFTSAATLIQTALTAVLPAGATAPTVTYDVLSGGFVITSRTTGVASAVLPGTGPAAVSLMLNSNSGPIVSAGVAASNYATLLSSILAINTNWAGLATIFEPSSNAKQVIAQWVNGQNNDYLYAMWDTLSVGAVNSGDQTSTVYALQQSNISGTAPLYAPVNNAQAAAGLLGTIASIDFNQPNGRTNLAFQSVSGLPNDVTNGATAANLDANGYNFFGGYATAAQQFSFLNPGSVLGPFLWIDSYVNQIWLTNNLQLALMIFLQNVKSVPYNNDGYAAIEETLKSVAEQGVDFGAIRTGVRISPQLAAEIQSRAGLDISTTLATQGWYIQVLDPGDNVRVSRGSPVVNFFYVDGQSVQVINVSSTDVQ